MSEQKLKKEVVIVQNGCPHYRIAFYNGLRDRLKDSGVKLRLLHGSSNNNKQYSSVFYAEMPWAEPFTTFYFPSKKLPPAAATWHPVLTRVLKADLIIVEAASRHMVNYPLCLLRQLGGPCVAFWGHGWSHASRNPNGLSERAKEWMSRRGDWYFAYTSEVKRGLIERGFDPARISDVQNAVEAPPALQLSDGDRAALREAIPVGADDTIALFCGRMYAAKRLDFLLSAAERVRQEVPSFQLLLAGGGPDEAIAKEAGQRRGYVHFVGPLFGERKRELFAISDLVLMPGLVGLGVVDAFHHAVPPVATSYPYHSPEFAYIRQGENGVISDDAVEAFAEAIIGLARDETLRSKLTAGCKRSAAEISIDEMIRRFGNGILSALAMDSIGTARDRAGRFR